MRKILFLIIIASFVAFLISKRVDKFWPSLSLRDKGIFTFNMVNLAIDHRATVKNVIVGKDGYLFFREGFEIIEDQNCTDEKFNEVSRYLPSKLAILKNAQQIAAFAGMDLRISISPDKSVVLPEYLTERTKCFWQYKEAYSQARRAISAQYGVKEYYDLVMDIKAEYGDKYDIYYRGDTHWAPIVQKEVLRDLTAKVYDIPLSNISPIKLNLELRYKVSDLYLILKVNKKDRDYALNDSKIKALVAAQKPLQKTIILHDSFYGMFLEHRPNFFQSEDIIARHIEDVNVPEILTEQEPQKIIVNSVERLWEERTELFDFEGFIYNYILGQHHKKAKACAEISTKPIMLDLQDNIMENSDIIVDLPELNKDICIKVNYTAEQETMLDIFYNIEDTFNMEQKFRYKINPDDNALYFMLPKDYSGQFLKFRPAHKSKNFTIHIQAFEHVSD